MQDSAQHLVFAAPELVSLIAQYLSPRDISQWMMSCKTFSRQLEPYFWSHPVITNTLDAPKSLVRHARHFQSLEVSLNKSFESFMVELRRPQRRTIAHVHASAASNVGFPSLRRLMIYTLEHTNPPTSNLLLILYHSPNLTELNIQRSFTMDPPLMQVLLIVLETQLPCLQRLAIQVSNIHQVTGFDLLEVCFNHPQLIDLQCGFYFDNDYVPKLDALLKLLQDADKSKAEAGLPTGLRLKSLMLPDIWEGYPKDFLLPFLRSQVPVLERFRMPCVEGLVSEDDMQELEEAITVGCPRLTHLSGRMWFTEVTNYEGGFIAALHSCARNSGLKSFIGSGYCEEEHSENGSVVQELLEHHADTLEEIEFHESIHVNSGNINRIFSTCKNLRTLRMSPFDYPSMSLRFQDVSTEWACRDLTVLQLFMDRQVVVPQGRNKVDIVTQAVQRFFAQVGRLTSLEELGLGSRMDLEREEWKLFAKDLTLDNGWLAELSGLKQLRHLRMYTDYWSSMVREDVEFMHVNWPKLEKISFGIDDFDEEVLEDYHWEWLKRRRPYLALVPGIKVFGMF
ncbi:MAG: hypothetical protein J3Q66DRAFT_330736 [Benniella sp.]|nr:MAG: hypothetical protein J3Q66DRAFT_330736 [Benniella sp.]